MPRSWRGASVHGLPQRGVAKRRAAGCLDGRLPGCTFRLGDEHVRNSHAAPLSGLLDLSVASRDMLTWPRVGTGADLVADLARYPWPAIEILNPNST